MVYNRRGQLADIPARSISWWLMTGVAGVSFSVGDRYWLVRMLLRVPFRRWNRLKRQPDTKKSGLVYQCGKMPKRGERKWVPGANTSKTGLCHAPAWALNPAARRRRFSLTLFFTVGWTRILRQNVYDKVPQTGIALFQLANLRKQFWRKVNRHIRLRCLLGVAGPGIWQRFGKRQIGFNVDNRGAINEVKAANSSIT